MADKIVIGIKGYWLNFDNVVSYWYDKDIDTTHVETCSSGKTGSLRFEGDYISSLNSYLRATRNSVFQTERKE